MIHIKNKNLEKKIIQKSRIVKDFPKKDVNFIDISPIFEDISLYQEIINEFNITISNLNANKIIGIESRGFLLASPLAIKSNIPLVLARKAGKVPFRPVRQDYGLEYGEAALEISEAQINRGDNVVIVDDIIATGGTIEAVIKIINSLKAKAVYILALGDIANLNHKAVLQKYNVPIGSLAEFVF